MTTQESGPERALQLLEETPIPAATAALVRDILAGMLTLNEAVDAAIAILRDLDAVDRISVVSTVVPPDDRSTWTRLGDRAWLKEWTNGNVERSASNAEETTADEALSLPWLSQQSRRDGIVVLVDSSLLDHPAERDRFELERDGIRAMVAAPTRCEGLSYGSIGCGRETPGPWVPALVASVRALCAALGARMAALRDRAVLVDAIARGDRARESQQQFFSALGHELRTPLTGIVGTAEAMADEASEMLERPAGAAQAAAPVDAASFAAQVAHDSQVVLDAGERLLSIVNDLLGIGQELGGGAEAEPVPVADAVADVLHWQRAPALNAGVTLSADVPADLAVTSTPGAYRQVLRNLVSNAIMYNERGGTVTLTSSSSVDETGTPRVRVTVYDTGPGLTPAQAEDVFKPFVRFDTTAPGTGLGLPLARALAERDGGLMGVESTVGSGSAFWVDMPAPAHR